SYRKETLVITLLDIGNRRYGFHILLCSSDTPRSTINRRAVRPLRMASSRSIPLLLREADNLVFLLQLSLLGFWTRVIQTTFPNPVVPRPQTHVYRHGSNRVRSIL